MIMDCIFCKIAAKEIPAKIVIEIGLAGSCIGALLIATKKSAAAITSGEIVGLSVIIQN